MPAPSAVAVPSHNPKQETGADTITGFGQHIPIAKELVASSSLHPLLVHNVPDSPSPLVFTEIPKSIPGEQGPTVKSQQKISDTQGNFTGVLDDGDSFSNPNLLGDLNNDGINDIAVSAPSDDDGGSDRGAIYILYMDTNGMVKSHKKIIYHRVFRYDICVLNPEGYLFK